MYPLFQSWQHVATNQPRVRSRPDKTVNSIHDTSMLRQQISKILESGISFQHRSGQISQQAEQAQYDPVQGSRQDGPRPSLHPRTKNGQNGADGAASNHALHALVGTGGTRCGRNGPELGLAVLAPHKVGTYVAKGEAEPRPKNENRTRGNGQDNRILE